MKIAVAAREKLPPAWVERNAVIPASSTLVNEIEGIETCWILRKEAESDPDWKQLIPYVLVRDQTGSFFCYRRKGSEGRLHGLFSIGLGGHIEFADYTNGNSVMDTIKQGAYRELREELGLHSMGELLFLGLINEEISKVGTVHLGLVYILNTEREFINVSEETSDYSWREKDAPEWDELELWSVLALQLVELKI